MSEHIDEQIQTNPYQDKPITHTVIVTAPIQVHRWATSEEPAEQKAQESITVLENVCKRDLMYSP